MGAELIQSAAPQNYAAFSDILQTEVIVPALILLVTTVFIQQVILKIPYFTKVLCYEILEVVESQQKLLVKAKLMLALFLNAAEVCFPALTLVRNWFAWGPRNGDSTCFEKKEMEKEQNLDEDCDLLSDSDISTADEEEDSDCYDEASVFSEASDDEEDEEKKEEEKKEPLFLNEIFLLEVLPNVPVLGRSLSATTRALLDGDEKKDEEKKLPAGHAPRFPLQIVLRRHFSEALGGRSTEYEVHLRGLNEVADFELRTSKDEDEEEDDDSEEPGDADADGWKRKTAKLPARAVRSVFSELRSLKNGPDGSSAAGEAVQKTKITQQRPQFEVTVKDAWGRTALAKEYRSKSFMRTPVDGLLEALVAGAPEMDGVE